ncbi:hypothetical protein E2C01_033288 [Portunus trituberculatus]|uniref:Uncharacterized protein n=1 Tax=Portunus trituberculatus TaxID=210409 RepID=A0A5B7EXG8_PORTR|nr:hypothetical protein [Portunus trituberculatus]
MNMEMRHATEEVNISLLTIIYSPHIYSMSRFLSYSFFSYRL